MTKSELEKIYRKVAEEIGFKKDPVREGWMPKLGPNDYRCKIVHGFTKKGPVTLTVGPKGAVGMEALKLAGDYALVEKKTQPCITLPQVWDLGNYSDRSWVARERVEGSRPLFFCDYSMWAEKRKVAELYWNTVKIFSDVKSEKRAVDGFEYFIRERLDRWIEIGRDSRGRKNEQKQKIFRNVADEVFSFVFYETDIGKRIAYLEMELFFRNFGNTDIVLQDDKFYMPSPNIAFFPQFYGAAYFVWNVLMYSYDRRHLDILVDVEHWRRAFMEKCRNEKTREVFGKAFYVLLLERVFGALLVDIPRGRSPLGTRHERDEVKAGKSEEMFVAVLKYLLEKLPTLVENKPFEENIKKLDKLLT
ncbi:MAG: hypothetical protein HYX21_00105 [Candidatus Yanofskybacteria bacterium]|nr:hypothetical protein [Candidatus Yanofskybacteria bacterium]